MNWNKLKDDVEGLDIYPISGKRAIYDNHDIAELAKLALAGKRLEYLLQISRLSGYWDDHPDCGEVDAALTAFHKAEEKADE